MAPGRTIVKPIACGQRSEAESRTCGDSLHAAPIGRRQGVLVLHAIVECSFYGMRIFSGEAEGAPAASPAE